MNFDIIARPLGKFLLFIYETVAFQNYGLAIIIFTLIVKFALMPLTLKQLKSSAKMQELQPIIGDIQKRYKDDKEKLNQEMMKVYQENNYNPASGCLPLLVQMPILITLYWVIIQPIKFMLGKSQDVITKLVDVAAAGLGRTVQSMVTQKELLTLNYFNENKEALSQVTGLLDRSELIDFNNFLGLHLGVQASFQPEKLFGAEANIYIPLFILAILATVTTFISTKLTMPKKDPKAAPTQMSGMTSSMMYIGPLMTLMFAFQLPAGVVLYWMVGYVFAIFQQLFINKHMHKKKLEKEQEALSKKKAEDERKALESANAAADINNGNKQLNAGSGNKENKSGNNNQNSNRNSGNKKKGAK